MSFSADEIYSCNECQQYFCAGCEPEPSGMCAGCSYVLCSSCASACEACQGPICKPDSGCDGCNCIAEEAAKIESVEQ